MLWKVRLSGRVVFCRAHDLSLTQSHSLPRLHCYNEHSPGMAVTHWAQRDNSLPQPGRHSKPQCYQTLSNLSPWDSCVSPAPTWPDQTQRGRRERTLVQVWLLLLSRKQQLHRKIFSGFLQSCFYIYCLYTKYI